MSKESMNFRTDVKNVKGLGTSKSGFGHWWMQRITGTLMLPCGLYLLFALTTLNIADASVVVTWMNQPFNGIVTLLFALAASYHGALGIQVVLEDYVHNHAVNLTLRFLTMVLMIVMMMVSIYSVASILLG